MLKSIAPFLLLLIVGCAQEPVNYINVLVERNGMFYTTDKNKPYTGAIFSLHANGKKRDEGTVKNGKRDGIWTELHKNGQKKSEKNYKNGEKDGL